MRKPEKQTEWKMMLMLFLSENRIEQASTYTHTHHHHHFHHHRRRRHHPKIRKKNEKISCCYVLYALNAKFLCVSNARQFSPFLFCFICPHRIHHSGSFLVEKKILQTFSILFAMFLSFFLLVLLCGRFFFLSRLVLSLIIIYRTFEIVYWSNV